MSYERFTKKRSLACILGAGTGGCAELVLGMLTTWMCAVKSSAGRKSPPEYRAHGRRTDEGCATLVKVFLSASLRRVTLGLSFVGLCCVAALPRPSQATGAPAVSAGAKLFTETGCPQCHGPAGLGTEKGPSLRDLRKRKKPDETRKQIHDGGAAMPPFDSALTDEEIGSLVDFLQAKNGWKSLPKPPAP